MKNINTMIVGALKDGTEVTEIYYLPETNELVYNNEGALLVIDDLFITQPLDMAKAFDALSLQLLQEEVFGQEADGVIFTKEAVMVITSEYTAEKRALSNLKTGVLETFDIDINTVYTGKDFL